MKDKARKAKGHHFLKGLQSQAMVRNLVEMMENHWKLKCGSHIIRFMFEENPWAATHKMDWKSARLVAEKDGYFSNLEST